MLTLILGLLTQAWAQSVRDDSSLIIFHGGNFERIGLRHRKSQTLFLSELIHVSKCQNPSYGKLHVGLYIAAIRDSIDRSAQSSEIEPIGGNPKHSDHDRLTTGDSKKRLLPDYIPVETNKRHKKDEEHKPTTVNNKEQVKMDPKQNNEVCHISHDGDFIGHSLGIVRCCWRQLVFAISC